MSHEPLDAMPKPFGARLRFFCGVSELAARSRLWSRRQHRPLSWNCCAACVRKIKIAVGPFPERRREQARGFGFGCARARTHPCAVGGGWKSTATPGSSRWPVEGRGGTHTHFSLSKKCSSSPSLSSFPSPRSRSLDHNTSGRADPHNGMHCLALLGGNFNATAG